MIDIKASRQWHSHFPGGHVGVLLVGNADNSKKSVVLNREKKVIESYLREQYSGFGRKDFSSLSVIQAYRRYYKRFKKSYHVQLQIESIVLKDRSLPNVSVLVDANFMAEMKTMVLTAGHDADLLAHPVRIDVTKKDDAFVRMNGKEKVLKPGDMMMTDGKGIVCTIIYGQDQRTAISKKTRRALYVAYAPDDVSKQKVHEQLDLIQKYVTCALPESKVELRQIFSADRER